jgi:hypothetical protein
MLRADGAGTGLFSGTEIACECSSCVCRKVLFSPDKKCGMINAVPQNSVAQNFRCESRAHVWRGEAYQKQLKMHFWRELIADCGTYKLTSS